MRRALLVASKAGLGHVVRMRALAVALTESGWACHTVAPDEEVRSIVPDLLILDAPEAPAHFSVSEAMTLVRVIDTRPAAFGECHPAGHCDLTIFGSAGAEDEARPHLLAGPRYALLRREFAEERHVARTRAGVLDLRTIGGWSPGELAREMAEAIVAVSYGGMRALEAACVGTPSVLIPRNEGERLNAHGLMAAGAALIADESEAETMAQSLIEMPALAERMSQNAKALVDGHGLQRVVRAIGRFFP